MPFARDSVVPVWLVMTIDRQRGADRRRPKRIVGFFSDEDAAHDASLEYDDDMHSVVVSPTFKAINRPEYWRARHVAEKAFAKAERKHLKL